jgi:hypothetical protein
MYGQRDRQDFLFCKSFGNKLYTEQLCVLTVFKSCEELLCFIYGSCGLWSVFFFFIYLPLFYVSSVILWRILCFFLEILWRILCFSVDPMKNFMFFCRSYKEFIFFRRSYENFYVLSEILCRILCFDIFFKKWICLFDVWVNTGAFYTDIVSTDT